MELDPSALTIADPDWLDQAAAIPLRRGDSGLEVLLVSTSSGGWTVPKGWLEAGETHAHAAKREAFEEAGVTGRVLGPALGCFGRLRRGKPVRVGVLAMEVEMELDAWPEMHKRERRWIPLAEATRMISRWDLAKIVGQIRPDLLGVGTRLRQAV